MAGQAISRTAAALMIASISIPQVGFAAEPASDCGCAGAATIGTVSSVNGDVLATTEAGFGPAKSGMSLAAGSSLMTGPQSSAKVSFGESCERVIGANSTVSVNTVGTQSCLNVVTSSAVAPVVAEYGQNYTKNQRYDNSDGRKWVFLAGGIGLLVVGGIIIAISN